MTFAGNENGKLLALRNMIKAGGLVPPTLIFVQSIDRAQDLYKELVAYDVKSDVMHSGRSKEERDSLVRRFADSQIWALVCTDVMSRGIDFRGVELVIKYVSLLSCRPLELELIHGYAATTSHKACRATSTE